jgi:hypothetical protein
MPVWEDAITGGLVEVCLCDAGLGGSIVGITPLGRAFLAGLAERAEPA